MERYFLHTHFPDGQSVKRSRQGDERLTLGKVFFSNVSAAIRRDVLLKYPFDENLIMSEDQQFARDVLMAGYSVIYQPKSVVIHSHDYSLGTVFRRYFDSVYSLTYIFPHHDMGVSASMGLKYLMREIGFMVCKYPLWLPYYFCYTVAKTTGTVAGHFADNMPACWLKKFSLHGYHWRK